MTPPQETRERPVIPRHLLARAAELFAACPEAPGLCLLCRVVKRLVEGR